MKPTKIRNRKIYRAMNQTVSKQICATLSKDLRKKYPRRSARIMIDDTVKVIRGEYKGLTGKVAKISTESNSIAIEGNKKEKLKGEKIDALAAADVSLAASGTVALELAMSGTPAVITYRMNPISGWLAKRLIHVRFANLVNLILDHEAIPERLLNRCRPEVLIDDLSEL